MLKKILLGLLTVVVGILVYANFRSPDMHVERSMVMKATPEKLFPYINNSQQANSWMPWQESDANVKMQYSGPQEGVGSKSSWNSTGQMGTGEAEVVESVMNQSVKTRLTYTKPMNMSQEALITLTPVGTAETRVTWSVSGKNTYIFKLIGIFMNCDKMIGGEFEKGLNKLKKMVE